MWMAIDIGNTNSVFALIKESKIIHQFRISTDAKRTADEYFVLLARLCETYGMTEPLTRVVLTSTVPAAVFNIRMLAKVHYECEILIIGAPEVTLDIPVRVEKGTRVGPDRLVNAIAGFEKYGPDLILVDLGTATTFDVVGSDGGYEGGIIAPGVNLSLKALSDAAAALPHIDVSRPNKVIGTNTKGAMQSGIFWGYISLMEGICDRIEEEHGRKMKRIMTGGLAPLFARGTTKFDAIDGDLTLDGLILIEQRN